VDVSPRVYSQRRNNGEFVFDILKLFRRGTIISLEMPTETLRLIQRAAAMRGCSVNEFIIEATMRRAREILPGLNVASADQFGDPDLTRDRTPMQNTELSALSQPDSFDPAITAGYKAMSEDRNRERDAIDSFDVGNRDIKEKRRVWIGRKPLSLDEANQLVRDAREQRDRQNTGEPDR
jgi:Protein of unknown function (DUF1778)